MRVKIYSPTYGERIVFIDKEDWEPLKRYKWGVWRSPLNGKFYVVHSWKRGGEEVTIRMHRMILGVSDPGIKVDHIDGDSLNNTRRNLRIATCSQNSMNRGKTVKNRSGFKGVIFEPKKKLYRVVITANRKVVRAGRFKNPVDAAKKYNELAIKYHGEFARLNKITNV